VPHSSSRRKDGSSSGHSKDQTTRRRGWLGAAILAASVTAGLLVGVLIRRGADGQGRSRPVADLSGDFAASPLTPGRPSLPDGHSFPSPKREELTGLHPRAQGEWQGMRVDLSVHPDCTESARCGLARACRAGMCLPCLADPDCASGELCVLDHCILSGNVDCRSKDDCETGDVCILTGFSTDPRNNAATRAICGKSFKAPARNWKPAVSGVPPPKVEPRVDHRALLDLLRQDAGSTAESGHLAP
jgi:hypothetical protein